MAEALNGTYKSELVKPHRPWRSRADLELATIEWIDWYNERRLHSEIRDIPSAKTKPLGTVTTRRSSRPNHLTRTARHPGWLRESITLEGDG